MLLTFKTVDQVIFRIDVDPSEKIECLKKRIQKDRGCEYIAEGMKLLFAGRILDDEKTISDYSISDKSFIVIMVPRPKTPGKECSKKSRSTQAMTPAVSTIHESTPLSFDAYLSNTDPSFPLSYSQQRQRYPRSGNSSDYETSTASQGKVYRSQVSTDGGQPAHGSKRHSVRSSTSSDSSRHAVTAQVGIVSPDVVSGSSPVDYMPSMESYATCETDMLMSPLQSSEEQWKNSEVNNWLEKHVIEEPVSAVEHSLSVDETVVENVQKIVAMGFEKEQAEVALNASYNSVEGAIEYLCMLIPAASTQPPVARVPSVAWIPPVVQRFPSVVRSRTDLDDPLEFLKTNEEFQFLRLEVQKNPDLLASALEDFRSSHSDLEPVFKAFEDRLVELLTEPPEHSQSHASSAIVMDTAQSPVNSLSTLDPTENETSTQPSPRSLDHSDPIQSSSSDTDQLLDPVQSSSADTDRLLDPSVVSDDLPSSSLGSIERGVPPVGEDACAIGAPPEEDVKDEDEEKLSEELIQALLLQEEEERLEAERRAAGAAEADLWNDAASLESSVAGGAGSSTGGRGGRGGGRMLEERGYVRVTMEEKQAIDRLKALGFAEERVVQVYLACDKNEEMTANILLDKD